jgi:hypothetical protein
MWGIDADERHRDALARGDLILIYLGAPVRESELTLGREAPGRMSSSSQDGRRRGREDRART